jgi:bifunctional DNA-binding transcriptional regulator/antitoxin component of YhaV-PrlF toxin-antitoxin module
VRRGAGLAGAGLSGHDCPVPLAAQGIAGPADLPWRMMADEAPLGEHAMRVRVTPDGRLSLPAELRRRHGLAEGGEVSAGDAGEAIVLRTLDQVVSRAQALSRKLVAGEPGATVDDLLAERAREAEAE